MAALSILEGKKALTLEGISSAMHQISTGLQAFAPVLGIDLEQFRDMPSPDEEELLASESEEEESDQEAEEDLEVDKHIVLHSVKDVSLACDFQVSVESPANGVYCWCFPEEISQGCYNGRNGSSACSVISLIIGYVMSKGNVPLPPCSLQQPLPDLLVKAICGSIQLGNHLYDVCRESLPARYLSIEEAASVLRPCVQISADDPLPIRLTDEHELSTLCGQLAQSGENNTASIIINERTSTFHLSQCYIVYIDTHKHISKGVLVVAAHRDALKDFCTQIWKNEGHCETTFGNLVFVKFH